MVFKVDLSKQKSIGFTIHVFSILININKINKNLTLSTHKNPLKKKKLFMNFYYTIKQGAFNSRKDCVFFPHSPAVVCVNELVASPHGDASEYSVELSELYWGGVC